ncbi:MAG: CRTAC1 family protein [Actinomycetota bacterium]
MMALVLLSLIAVGCTASDGDGAIIVDAETTSRSLASAGEECTGTFVPVKLDHTTRGRGVITAMSDGTGAGVLLEDLDDDGLVDIVLPNLAGETSILWNRGDLRFDRRVLAEGRFRQAIAVDVDGDGARDVLLTTGIGPPVTLRATEPAPDDQADAPVAFVAQEFRTRAVSYSMAAGDLDGDGGLRLVTGSYNAELTQNRDPRVLTGTDVGIAIHNLAAGAGPDEIATEFLTTQAQALVTLVVDLDDDGRRDVFVGNDLGTPDGIWLGDPAGLVAATPFDSTTLSTMSLDVADLDNDGDRDVIATDMAPMAGADPDPWLGVAEDIEAAMIDDVQEPRNKLQFAGDDGYEDRAADLGFEATGWSWSGVAGDLDADGLLDLYVVNGMQATSIFPDLVDGALIEANQAFRNTGDGLAPAPDWGMAETAGGRGMAQADLDGDGDLDVVINNLGSPAVLLENRICAGPSVIVDPRWDGVANADALGSTVTVIGGDDVRRSRQILSSRGYLSSPPTEAHVGLGVTAGPFTVEVTWPDGAVSTVADVESGTHLTVTRTAPPVEPAVAAERGEGGS